ncbi:MAG TPA: dethiobiotin synthase [Sphingomicrobium sp.]|nr:dethiobiotin synthase [Sphingomicrobium sp.]
MKLFISGTDTDVGKTTFAAALSGALQASYWKPIQAGGLDRSDSDLVRELSGLPPYKVCGEGYRLRTPCSPHRAAELDGVTIDVDGLKLPECDPLVVEGAGGLLVPLTRDILIIDLIARWNLPTVLVARTSLGTINHSLMSVAALRSRNIPLIGIAFVGHPYPDSEDIICTLSAAKRLGRLPFIDPLDRANLQRAFSDNFCLDDFR